MNNGLWTSVKDNVVFVLVSVGIAAALFGIAYLTEKICKKKNGSNERILSTRKMVMIGVFAAISAVLMMFEFPVPFAPSFYELDFSEIPALIGAFAFVSLTISRYISISSADSTRKVSAHII